MKTRFEKFHLQINDENIQINGEIQFWILDSNKQIKDETQIRTVLEEFWSMKMIMPIFSIINFQR